jgi:hypothetical protein
MGGFGSLGPTEQGSFLAYKHVVLNKIDVCVLASMGYGLELVRQRQHKSFPIDNANVVGWVARLGFGFGLETKSWYRCAAGLYC